RKDATPIGGCFRLVANHFYRDGPSDHHNVRFVVGVKNCWPRHERAPACDSWDQQQSDTERKEENGSAHSFTPSKAFLRGSVQLKHSSTRACIGILLAVQHSKGVLEVLLILPNMGE